MISSIETSVSIFAALNRMIDLKKYDATNK